MASAEEVKEIEIAPADEEGAIYAMLASDGTMRVDPSHAQEDTAKEELMKEDGFTMVRKKKKKSKSQKKRDAEAKKKAQKQAKKLSSDRSAEHSREGKLLPTSQSSSGNTYPLGDFPTCFLCKTRHDFGECMTKDEKVLSKLHRLTKK